MFYYQSSTKLIIIKSINVKKMKNQETNEFLKLMFFGENNTKKF